MSQVNFEDVVSITLPDGTLAEQMVSISNDLHESTSIIRNGAHLIKNTDVKRDEKNTLIDLTRLKTKVCLWRLTQLCVIMGWEISELMGEMCDVVELQDPIRFAAATNKPYKE